MSITYKAPGKIFISGEWGVLVKGNPCIVAAVNKYVYSTAKRSNNYSSLKIPSIGLEVDFEILNGKVEYVSEISQENKQYLKYFESCIFTMYKYCGVLKNFEIETSSDELEIEGIKLGFGSSGAFLAVMVSVIADLNDIKLSKLQVYKLAIYANYLAQGKVGSGFDIAASVFGGLIKYKRFDKERFVDIDDKDFVSLIDKDWEELVIEELKYPENLIIDVGWVGKAGITRELVADILDWGQKEKGEFLKIMREIGDLNAEIIKNIENFHNEELLISLWRENGELLSRLTNLSGVELETSELKLLREIANKFDAAGKFSGSGGGDIGLSFTFDREISNQVREGWEKNNVIPLDVSIDERGVVRTD